VQVQQQVPKTDIQALMTDLKSMRDKLEYNPRSATTPVKLDSHAFSRAYEIVQKFLLEAAPDHYPRAEQSFQRFSKNLVTPAEKGPLGIIAGNEARDNTTVPFSRLESVVNRQAPGEIPQTLASLAKGGGDPDLKSQIARVLLQQRIRPGKGDLSEGLMGGEPDSLAFRQTQALLNSVGGNTSAFREPVETAGLLSRINSAADRGGMTQRAKDAGTSAATLAFSPFQDAWVRAMLHARKVNYQAVAHLLANPTQENLALLRQLAQSDPALRLRLGLGGGVLGAGNSGLPPEE